MLSAPAKRAATRYPPSFESQALFLPCYFGALQLLS
jgi:hypothetical protein